MKLARVRTARAKEVRGDESFPSTFLEEGRAESCLEALMDIWDKRDHSIRSKLEASMRAFTAVETCCPLMKNSAFFPVSQPLLKGQAAVN